LKKRLNQIPPAVPHSSQRHILLAVTGMTPQIVTETLYALAVAPGAGQRAFIPTEIHLITTSEGAKLARTALLHPDGGKFHALLADYPQLGHPVFDDANIHVIGDAAGQPLADIRTPEENASAADSITALMAQLTRDDKARLHVSIAGGRKTMGFYLGYAFSLFARPQDELSHVLVSSPFENLSDFFFPPAKPRRLTTRDDKYIDTADARITLARIPVVRLRHGQPQALLEGKASFNDTVAAIQRGLAPPHLSIDLRQQRVLCGGNPVNLPPALVAWMAWWAQQVLQGHGSQNWRDDAAHTKATTFLTLYRCVLHRDAEAVEKAALRLKNGMEKEFFQENNSKLERELKRQLGLAAAPYLLITSGKRPHTRRSLSLKADGIELRD
jgi:CRISPR-associated protein (TIGR02584 family)